MRIIADGERAQQSFRLLRDPRLTDVTFAEMQAQFEFAKATHQRLNDATTAVVRMHDIKRQVQDRLQRSTDGEIATAAASLVDGLVAVEEDVYEVRVTAESDIKHFGPKLMNKLANVYAVSQSADGRPTTQAQAVFTELSTKLGVQLVRLDALRRNELARLNDLLRRAGLPPVVADPTAM